jgi:hypothetical protein
VTLAWPIADPNPGNCPAPASWRARLLSETNMSGLSVGLGYRLRAQPAPA